MTTKDTYKPPTRDQRKLLQAADLIWEKSADPKDAAFMARQLVQATFPHKNPGDVPVWTRTNGRLTLAVQPGVDPKKGKIIGYPYGTVPRLLLFWLTTEAVKTKSRRIELGHSLTGFMNDIGLNPNNGSLGAKRSDAHRLREQMERLFQARISFYEDLESDKNAKGYAWLNMEIAPRGVLWWNPKMPEQDTLWGSWIELGEDFFKAITAAPIPVDVRALKALKRSPLALDLYAWLTYEAFRAHKSGKARFETWDQLHAHMGGEYTHINHFRAKVKAALVKIKTVYPHLKLGRKQGGVEILPESLPALTPRPATALDGVATTP